MEQHMDAIVNGVPQGQVGSFLMNRGTTPDGNFDVGLLRPYITKNKQGQWIYAVNSGGQERIVNSAVLRKEEWVEYDKALLFAARQRLIGVADLMSRGLTYTMAGGWGKTVLEYEEMSGMNAAEINMDGVTRGRNDRVTFNIKYLPLPIVHKAFQINARVLAASRNGSSALDTTQVTESAYKVAEYLEAMLFTGVSSYAFGGGTIYGYLDYPQRITGSLGVHWNDLTDESTVSAGQHIIAKILDMKQKSIDANHYGPWVLYIPAAYEHVLETDYLPNYPGTIRERILKISGIQDVKVPDKLTADNVLLVQMTPDVVQWVTGMPLSNVEWSTEGTMVHNFKVMTIQVPRIRSDADGNTGVVHYS